jgi:hypothetical protein
VRKPGNHRALKVIRMLRLRHQKQAQQIDILCQDMVSAHRQFAVKLGRMMDVTEFQETLLGCAGLQETLDTAIRLIEKRSACAAAVCLVDESGLEVRVNGGLGEIDLAELQSWFTKELIHNISLTSRVCSLNQLLQMGLQAPPAILKTLHAAAVPLSRAGQAVGFILMVRPASSPLAAEDLSFASAVSRGLCSAITACQSSVKQPQA